jgi:hypothetical protein
MIRFHPTVIVTIAVLVLATALYSAMVTDHPTDSWAQCHYASGTAIYTKECSNCSYQFRECRKPPLPPIVRQDGNQHL